MKIRGCLPDGSHKGNKFSVNHPFYWEAYGSAYSPTLESRFRFRLASEPRLPEQASLPQYCQHQVHCRSWETFLLTLFRCITIVKCWIYLKAVESWHTVFIVLSAHLFYYLLAKRTIGFSDFFVFNELMAFINMFTRDRYQQVSAI